MLKSRVALYDAKLIAGQIGSGQDYDAIQKAIGIIIADEELIAASQRYHHRFTFYDPVAGVEFSDIIELHTLELLKLPEVADGTKMYDWAMFIAAKSDEELDKVAERNAEVRKAVIKYRELTADERTRDMFERREKARRDQVSRENWARQQGIQQGIQQGLVERNIEIARNLLGMNLSSNQIITATGLTLEEIENLK